MLYEYYMTITEMDGTEYPFIGHFFDHDEAAQFLAENEAEGASVVIEYLAEVFAEDYDLNSLRTFRYATPSCFFWHGRDFFLNLIKQDF